MDLEEEDASEAALQAVVFEMVPVGSDVVAEVYASTRSVLGVLQSWLIKSDSGVLVVVTRGAVALPGEDVIDLAGAAVWGVVRSAQTEHPGRLVLVDSDASLDDAAVECGIGFRRAAGVVAWWASVHRAGAWQPRG